MMEEEWKECQSCYYYVFGTDKEHCNRCVESVNEKGIDGFAGYWKPIYED